MPSTSVTPASSTAAGTGTRFTSTVLRKQTSTAPGPSAADPAGGMQAFLSRRPGDRSASTPGSRYWIPEGGWRQAHWVLLTPGSQAAAQQNRRSAFSGAVGRSPAPRAAPAGRTPPPDLSPGCRNRSVARYRNLIVPDSPLRVDVASGAMLILVSRYSVEAATLLRGRPRWHRRRPRRGRRQPSCA